jgi:hypothetical protein
MSYEELATQMQYILMRFLRVFDEKKARKAYDGKNPMVSEGNDVLQSKNERAADPS